MRPSPVLKEADGGLQRSPWILLKCCTGHCSAMTCVLAAWLVSSAMEFRNGVRGGPHMPRCLLIWRTYLLKDGGRRRIAVAKNWPGRLWWTRKAVFSIYGLLRRSIVQTSPPVRAVVSSLIRFLARTANADGLGGERSLRYRLAKMGCPQNYGKCEKKNPSNIEKAMAGRLIMVGSTCVASGIPTTGPSGGKPR